MAKIMVVDDEGISESAASILKSEGFEVIIARGGEECLKKLREIRPDCIILDIVMPDMEGWRVLRRIKDDKTLSSIPVIMQGEINKRLCRLLDEAVHERGNHEKPAANRNFTPRLEEDWKWLCMVVYKPCTKPISIY